MKILFIENRGKSYTYQSIAKNLEKQGHVISWIVYNHAIKLDCGSINIIPYPKKPDLTYDQTILNQAIFKETAKSDRYVLHCNGNTNHYPYYLKQIETIIDKEKPDVVFGEVSTFYCTLCRLVCEQKNIPMYTEGGARYPRYRFTFNTPNRYRQLSSSGDTISFEQAKIEWQKIAQRKSKPNYMDALSNSNSVKLKQRLIKLRQSITYLWQNARGEKYVTRNASNALKNHSNRIKNDAQWTSFALKNIKHDNHFIILFPLQYQPEFNVDVWGNDFTDQSESIKKIAALMPKEAVLYVKPNPKSNLEMSQKIVNIVKNTDRVYGLNQKISMDAIFNQIDLIITTTGTASIECVFANKPIICLAETVADSFIGCIRPNNFNEVGELIQIAIDKKFPLADDNEKYRFYSHLLDSSHAGDMDDFTLSLERKISDENLALLTTGYLKFLKQLQSGALELKH